MAVDFAKQLLELMKGIYDFRPLKDVTFDGSRVLEAFDNYTKSYADLNRGSTWVVRVKRPLEFESPMTGVKVAMKAGSMFFVQGHNHLRHGGVDDSNFADQNELFLDSYIYPYPMPSPWTSARRECVSNAGGAGVGAYRHLHVFPDPVGASKVVAMLMEHAANLEGSELHYNYYGITYAKGGERIHG